MSEIIPENNAEYNAFAKEVFSYELVPRCTVPIACTKAGKSIANRTGILFRVAGIPFLITAKHGTHADNLIIDIVDAGYRLFIPPDKPDGKMVAFGIRDFLTSNRDGTDHAVIELDEPTADLLEAEGRLFAGIRDVAPMRTGQSARSSYLVAGFPRELEARDAEGRKRLEWFPWLTIPWAPWYGELPKVFSETQAQRCWVHKTANVLNKLPKSVQPRAKEGLHEIWMAETRVEAETAFDNFLEKYQAKYAGACECLKKDRPELLAFYAFPAEHWRHLRTTNPIESTFATIRLRHRRTKGSGSREASLMMMFKLAKSAERRWKKLNGHEQLPLLLAGRTFIDGVLQDAA